MKLKWEEITGIVLWVLSIGFLGISVFLSFSGDIWYDELFTMGLVNQSCGGLISITARDVHPPLYYLILKFFLMLSNAADASIFVQVTLAKIFSVFPFLLCLIYAVTKVRKHFGMFTAGLFSFLLLTMPQMADYTVEVRMYGWAVFFITAGMLHAYELTGKEDAVGKTEAEESGKMGRLQIRKCIDWAFLTIYSLAACYTHYFACVAACMIYLYLLIVFLAEHRLKKEIKAYLASGLFCAAGYFPWIISAVILQVGQVGENYWIQPLSLRTLGGCVKFLFMPSFSNAKLNILTAIFLFLLYGFLLLKLLSVFWKRQKKEDIREASFIAGSIFVLAGIVAFGFMVSFLLRPIFVYRYMLPAMGVFWLSFALLLSKCKEKKYICFPILIVLLVVGIRNYRAFYGEEMWKRVQMVSAQEAIEQIKEDDIIVFNFDQTQAVVSWYLDNETYLWYGKPESLIREMYPQVHALVEEEFSDEAGIDKMKELLAEYGQIWFFGSGNARDEIIQKWEAAGIKAEESGSVMIERYWFNLYKINE